MTSSFYGADAFVTAANPAPGRQLDFSFPIRSGTQWTTGSSSRFDGGIGMNVYIAGGTGPSGVLPVSQTNPPQISLSGVLSVSQTGSTTGTITNILVSMTGVQLLAPDSSRLGAAICNNSTSPLYLALSATASLTLFTVIVVPSGYYETPWYYQGAIWGACGVSGTTGFWYVTEVG